MQHYSLSSGDEVRTPRSEKRTLPDSPSTIFHDVISKQVNSFVRVSPRTGTRPVALAVPFITTGCLVHHPLRLRLLLRLLGCCC